MKKHTLWVSVWSHKGIFQHKQFLGEISIPLESHKFEGALREVAYKLNDYSLLEGIPDDRNTRHGDIIEYPIPSRVSSGDAVVLHDSSSNLAREKPARSMSREALPPTQPTTNGASAVQETENVEGMTTPSASVESESVVHEENAQKGPAQTEMPAINIEVPDDGKSSASVSDSEDVKPAEVTPTTETLVSPKPKSHGKKGHSSSKLVAHTAKKKHPSRAKVVTISASTRPSRARRNPIIHDQKKPSENKA